MIRRFRGLIFKIRKSNIVRNGLWLYLLQIFNTVIPLLTLPYITRILGPSQYGIFSSALNLVVYFQVLVEYGFGLSGVRKVALAKNKDEVSKIYTRITFSKLILLIVSFLLMLLIGFVLRIPESQFVSMIILYTMVIGTAIQQTWLFQGLQDMKLITIISVISRTISVILIFLLIKDASQVYFYSALYSLTYFLMGILSLLIVKIKFGIKFMKVSAFELFDEIRDGWVLFTTSAMSKIFSGVGITVLVVTSTEFYVGIYSALQKIPIIVKMIYAPIGQVVYPYVSKAFSLSYKTGIDKVKKVSKFVMPTFAFICFILIVSREIVVDILYGSDYVSYSYVLLPLILWMFLSVINNLLGIQILVASGHKKEYSKAFRLGIVALLVFNIIFGSLVGIMGVAVAAVLAELTLTISIIYYVLKIRNSTVNL